MQVEVLNIKGEKTGRTVTLPDHIFGVEPNDHVIWLDVKRYMNAQRQGTHKAKERSEMSGSTRKLFRQKGTGGARRGDINSPLLKGGARVFGPKVRDYDIKLNKKVRQLARKSALAHKAKENNVMVVEAPQFDAPKTKEYLNMLKALNVDAQRSLLVLTEQNENVLKSARNLQNASVMQATDLNTYAIMHANKIVFVEDAINSLNQNWK